MEDTIKDLKGVEFSRELQKGLEYQRGMMTKFLRDMTEFSKKVSSTDEKTAYLESHVEESKQAYSALREGMRRVKSAGIKQETKTEASEQEQSP